jgi:hypothetical protein
MNKLSNTTVARENLSSLPEDMELLADSNITEFNSYVKKQLKALAAGGEMTNEVINLWKGYARTKDKDFRQWIKQKKGEWFDRTFEVGPNGLDLMELAENHYKDSVKTKDWMKLDEDQQTIMTIQTEIQAVKATARHQSGRGSRNPKKRGKRMIRIRNLREQENGHEKKDPSQGRCKPRCSPVKLTIGVLTMNCGHCTSRKTTCSRKKNQRIRKKRS